jgi:hypothetical protein
VPTAQLLGGPAFRRRKLNESAYWRLGEENGLLLKSDDGRLRWFHAGQGYRVKESESQHKSAGKFRVTTLEYAYGKKWMAVLAKSKAKHEEYRSWSGTLDEPDSN